MSNFRLDVYLHFADVNPITALLSRIEDKMSATLDELNILKAKMDTLQNTTVANNTALLQGLNAIIADLKANPNDTATVLAAIKALEGQADTINQTIVDADLANQPPA